VRELIAKNYFNSQWLQTWEEATKDFEWKTRVDEAYKFADQILAALKEQYDLIPKKGVKNENLH
jgi:hypothetical protein